MKISILLSLVLYTIIPMIFFFICNCYLFLIIACISLILTLYKKYNYSYVLDYLLHMWLFGIPLLLKLICTYSINKYIMVYILFILIDIYVRYINLDILNDNYNRKIIIEIKKFESIFFEKIKNKTFYSKYKNFISLFDFISDDFFLKLYLFIFKIAINHFTRTVLSIILWIYYVGKFDIDIIFKHIYTLLISPLDHIIFNITVLLEEDKLDYSKEEYYYIFRNAKVLYPKTTIRNDKIIIKQNYSVAGKGTHCQTILPYIEQELLCNNDGSVPNLFRVTLAKNIKNSTVEIIELKEYFSRNNPILIIDKPSLSKDHTNTKDPILCKLIEQSIQIFNTMNKRLVAMSFDTIIVNNNIYFLEGNSGFGMWIDENNFKKYNECKNTWIR